MMKNLTLIALFALFLTQSAFAQIGATAPDFSITDRDGVEHNLYEILDAGKVVVVDVSATWCPPCWSMHEEHYLKDIYDLYGPNGTDQVHVIFYEGDVDTGTADLEGTTSGTMGDWLDGTEYPIVDEAPTLSLDLSIWSPQGFPTVNVISPNDKEIKADLWENWSNGTGLDAMLEIMESNFPTTSSVDAVESIDISVFPNPFGEALNIDLTNFKGELTSLELINVMGQVVISNPIDASNNNITVDVAALPTGMYVLNLINADEVVGMKKLVKE